MYQQYSGKRRYSNYTVTGGGYTLRAESANPAMGDVQILDMSLAEKEVTTGINNPGNDRGAQTFGTGLTTAGGGTTTAFKRYKITAKPNQGYRFIRWDYAPYISDPTNRVQTITLSRNMTFTAYFSKLPDVYKTVKVNWNATMGTVSNTTMHDGLITVRQGDYITLKATANGGYHFVKWTGGPSTVDGKTSDTVQFNVNNDYTIGAVFEADGGINPPAGGGEDNPLTGGDNHGYSPENPNNPYMGGGTGGGGNNVVVGGIDGPQSIFNTAIDFAKKYWWALLIAAYFIIDKKGGLK